MIEAKIDVVRLLREHYVMRDQLMQSCLMCAERECVGRVIDSLRHNGIVLCLGEIIEVQKWNGCIRGLRFLNGIHGFWKALR